MKKFNYLIVSPKNNHGGTIALHALCHFLSQEGENAKIFYLDRGFGNKNDFCKLIYSFLYSVKDFLYTVILNKNKTNLLKCKRKWMPFISKNTIVIYPEIVYGNFLRSKHVVRWLLYHNKIYSSDGKQTFGYDKNDLFFCYRDIFNDKKLNPEGKKLTLTHFDLDTYKRYNYGKRKGNCYIIRKGAQRPDIPEHFDGPVIDNLSETEKVKILNKCEYCISYDTNTAYSQIAALCGCVSVVIPESGKTRKNYRENEELSYGVAFGISENEINYAKETSPLLDALYNKLNSETTENAKKFILECETYFT